MPGTVYGTPNLKHGEGWVQELQNMADVMAEQLVGHVKTTAEAAGMPWGAEKLSDKEALDRIAKFDDPALADRLDQLSDHAVITAAIDAIRRRKKAGKEGEPMQLNGQDGNFIPGTVVPGLSPATPDTPPTVTKDQEGFQPVESGVAPGMVAPTSLPVQMGLPGL